MSFIVKNTIFQTLRECYDEIGELDPSCPAYYRIRDNFIEKIEFYSKKFGGEVAQQAIQDKPHSSVIANRLEAAALASKWVETFDLDKPDWIKDDKFSNTWRTPMLGQFVTVSGIHWMFHQMQEDHDSFYYKHAMFNDDGDFSVI